MRHALSSSPGAAGDGGGRAFGPVGHLLTRSGRSDPPCRWRRHAEPNGTAPVDSCCHAATADGAHGHGWPGRLLRTGAGARSGRLGAHHRSLDPRATEARASLVPGVTSDAESRSHERSGVTKCWESRPMPKFRSHERHGVPLVSATRDPQASGSADSHEMHAYRMSSDTSRNSFLY